MERVPRLPCNLVSLLQNRAGSAFAPCSLVPLAPVAHDVHCFYTPFFTWKRSWINFWVSLCVLENSRMCWSGVSFHPKCTEEKHRQTRLGVENITMERQLQARVSVVLAAHSWLGESLGTKEIHQGFFQDILHLEWPPLLSSPIILGLGQPSDTVARRDRRNPEDGRLIWGPLLTSATRLGALGEALIFPVIQLVQVLQAFQESVCIVWVKLRNFPVAGSCVTGTLRRGLGPFTFIHRQVSHGLRERQKHLASDYSHLGSHTAGDSTGRPSFWNEPAVDKETRRQDEKPQAGGHGGCEGLHRTCLRSQSWTRMSGCARDPPPRPGLAASR